MFDVLRAIFYYPFINLLTFFIWATPGHYAAVGIIGLTLVVRFILILPSKRAAQAQRKMAQMQPLMDELKKEYADDRQGMANAQMELYKKNNINPFGSCIPLLIQFPVLLILYRAILNGLTPHNPHIYSWIPQPDFINSNLFGINLLKPDVFNLHVGAINVALPAILPFLAAGTQFIQMKMVTPAPRPASATGEADPTQAIQQQTLLLLPLLTLYIARGFPAGISLYWIVTTLFSIAQQRQVNKEKLKLQGIDAALKEVDVLHPDHAPRQLPAGAVSKVVEPVGISPVIGQKVQKPAGDTSVKKGVSVTVRKKS
jgi:YidC/Oxa1 family membrane protein insertase